MHVCLCTDTAGGLAPAGLWMIKSQSLCLCLCACKCRHWLAGACGYGCIASAITVLLVSMTGLNSLFSVRKKQLC